MNAAIIIQLLIQGTEQLLKMQTLLQNANAQGRDVSDFELNSLSKELGDKIEKLRQLGR